MNEPDKHRIEALEKKMDDFISSLGEKFERWDALYYLLVGNKLDSKGSVLSRIADIEAREKEYEMRLQKLEESKTRIISYSIAIAFLVSSLWQVSKLLFSVWSS